MPGGKKVLRLRPYKACDAGYIVKWFKDEYSFRQWCADRYENYPITAQMMNSYYEEAQDNPDLWQMTAFDEKGVVGHLIMRFIDKEKNTLRFGFIIVDSEKRGRGYGKKMLELALDFAFHSVKVNRVTLGVFDNNKVAYEAYKSVGFYEVPVEKVEQYDVLGERWKCIEMAIDHKGY